MAARSTPTVPTPNADNRRVAAENFDRARQVIVTGNYDYGISLLMLCCKIDPGNFLYRQSLRRAQKEKYGNNLRGSRFAFFTTPRYKAKVKNAKAKRDYLKVLEYAEDVFYRNPWDLGTQMDMAQSFDALGLLDLAVFTLDQARQKWSQDSTLNRALARLFEKRGDFQQAIGLWQMVKEANPHDVEASHKAKDLAASETIAKGGYEEAAAGTKDSPIVARMEAAALDKQDKIGRDLAPLLKRIEADPTEPTLYVQLSHLYKRHHQDDRARAALQQGLGPTGNHFSIQLELMELELAPFRTNLELTDAKLKALKAKATETEGDDADFDGPTEDDLQKTRAKLKKEILNREVQILRTRAERFPADLNQRLELGIRLMKGDQLDDAITELQQARRDDKLKARAALYLGVCFKKRNNWRLAQRNFEEALQVLGTHDDPTRKEVLYQLATGSAENNDLARALDLGHELANLDYNYKGIGKLIDEWQNRLQKA